MHADFRIPSCDYADLLKATRVLTRNHSDVLRAYRLMAFNVLAHNRDDHAKNFAFVLDLESGHWALSPAYDLTWAPGPGGEHTTTVGGEGRDPTPEHMFELADPAGISLASARTMIDEVRQAISRWTEFADEAGVALETRELVAGRLSA